MRKFRTKIAYTLALIAAAMALPQAVLSLAQNQNESKMINAVTASAAATSQAKLLSPSSYEEYLRLNDPSDVSVTDGYTAIADGTSIYVFDRIAGVYKQYSHSKNVTKLQFSEANVLYFLDSENTLYSINAVGLNDSTTAINTGVSNCLTFTLHSGTVYYTTMSGISTYVYSAPLSNPTAKTELFNKRMYCPAIAFFSGSLYYMSGEEQLKKYNPTNKTDVSVAELPTVLSLSITENTLVATSVNGSFKAYSLSDSGVSEIFSANGDYASLCTRGDNVYVIKGTTVQNFSISNTKFTDFEIANASNSAHRLSGATEICLKDELLFIADAGNSRISVYNTETKSFQQAINTTMPPSFMVSDGETLLTANTQQAYIYKLSTEGYGNKIAELSASQIHGNVIGATEVYGVYYVATDTNRLYYTSEAEGTFAWTEIQRETHTANLLTSDVYGNLYAAHGNELYCYTETEFSSTTVAGEKIIDALPANTNKILIDYERNVYALSGNNLSVYTTANGSYSLTATHTFDEHFVYDTAPVVKSLAFGAKDSRAYVLYEGNYLTETTELGLSTLQTIACENTQNIFDNASADIRFTEVKKKALAIHFDIDTLQNASVFPYLSHERTAETQTALILGESGEYNLLSVYNPANGKRENCLVLKDDCTDLAQAEYKTVYTEAKTGYLVSSASAYKFPYLSDLFKKATLASETQVTLLGKLTGLETDYYEISYLDEDGNTVIAYLPTSFVTTFEGTPPETITETYGDPNGDRDSIFRLVYILLGGFAICVLVDFLFLRPRRKDEDEAENDEQTP